MERTKYMQDTMIKTYAGVAIEAIKTGTLTGAWEKCIARQIEQDVKADISEAVVIMESVGNDSLKAAYLITNSKIPDHARTTF